MDTMITDTDPGDHAPMRGTHSTFKLYVHACLYGEGGADRWGIWGAGPRGGGGGGGWMGGCGRPAAGASVGRKS
ncbi:hypothetical protein DENSPDRAFT_841767 [Dentipellis sp. KUC8613]|nr:hypothetical protein DENSPDRAFT_841767 [Dentipellis sp. KUC8613]